MKALKLVVIALMFWVNLLAVHPALADRPPIDENPDYIEITTALANLTQARDSNAPPEGLTMADVAQQITTLAYQKYIIETGEDTICRNETSQAIAVYGKPGKNSTAEFEQVLYLLPPGEETDEHWVCKGVYLPKDAKVAGLELTSAIAVKILPGTQIVLSENPDTGALELNLPPAKVLQSGDINWDIPDLAQADVTTQFPKAPLD